MSATATLVIMRHGKADPSSPSGRDRDRPLLPHGVENTILCAAALERMFDASIRIVSSEYVRARQTAETMLKTWHRKSSELIVDKTFNSDAPIDPMIDALRGYLDQPTIIVSHMPQVAEMVEIITASTTSFLFKPGAFAVIDLENIARLRGSISTFLTPSTIRRVLQAHEAR
ncbi:MAG: histidine phosphatase family protein [Bacteroidetes bacterium]|nr:histidine phosphatase family protein [Bacteroidota bacterium]